MKKITNLEISTMTFFLTRAYLISIGFNSLIKIAKQDSYVSIIIGTLIGIIPLLVFYLLFNYEPDLNIFDKTKKLFGSFIGNIINWLLIITIFSLGVFLFVDFVTFIHNQYLNNTPIIFISLIFCSVILYTLIQGVNSILRASSIFFFFCLILLLISISGLLFKIDLSNFTPSLIHNYYKGSFIFVSYNVLPLIIILQIPKNSVINNNKTSKFILIFYLIASLTVLISIISIIGVFGWKLSTIYTYPEFQVLKYVYFKGLSSKLDSILFFQNLFDVIVFIIFSLFFCINGLKLSNKKKNIIYIIILFTLIFNSEKISKHLYSKFLSPIILIVITFILILYMFGLLFKQEKPNQTANNQKGQNNK